MPKLDDSHMPTLSDRQHLEADLHRAGTHVMAHFNNLHVM
jgi:hypothetical protein